MEVCWYKHCKFPTPPVGEQGQYKVCDAHKVKDLGSECHFCTRPALPYKSVCTAHDSRLKGGEIVHTT